MANMASHCLVYLNCALCSPLHEKLLVHCEWFVFSTVALALSATNKALTVCSIDKALVHIVFDTLKID